MYKQCQVVALCGPDNRYMVGGGAGWVSKSRERIENLTSSSSELKKNGGRGKFSNNRHVF